MADTAVEVRTTAPEIPAAHNVDRRLPFGRQSVFAVQHVLIMYTGCVSVPLVFGAAAGLSTATIAALVNADLVVAGLITLIQSAGLGRIVGVRLPVICGATFAGLTPMIVIAKDYGMPAVYGSMLAGGLIGLVLAVPFSRIIRYFPPLVTGSVLATIGLSLIGVAGGLIVGDDPTAPGYASPGGIGLAAVVVLIAIGLLTLARGLVAQLAVLIALVAGTAIAIPLGLVDLGGMGAAHWLGAPTPFRFGAPEFPIAGVLAMAVVTMVVFAESTASMLALSEITGKRLTAGDLTRGLVGDALSGVLGGVFSGFPDTLFSQNVGAVATTRVYSRWVTATSGVLLFALGLVPKLGALVAALPGPIVGGVGLILFATVAMVGINTLRKVDLSDRINITVAAVAVGVGLLPEYEPSMFEHFPTAVQPILGSGITLTAATAFGLNLLLNHTPLGARARTATGTGRERGTVPAPALD